MLRISPKINSHARDLRKHMSDVERCLWNRIRGRQLSGFCFRRQHPIERYIVDFACLELKLVIELDGGQHMDQHQYDLTREQWLKAKGFKVLRFWNHDVVENRDGVLHAICNLLPPSQPSPLKGEGV